MPVTATVSNLNRFRYRAHTVTAKVTGAALCAKSNFVVAVR